MFAAEEVFASRGRRLPLIVSGTLTNSGRTLSGQTVEAFYASVAHARPLAVGFNCSFGARQLLPYLRRMADVSDYPVSVYPNAGLPNLAGEYEESPAAMAAQVEEYLRQGLVNIVGGCCGTTPEHIRAIAQVAARYAPRPLPGRRCRTMFAGLEPLVVDEATGFVNVGERTNVAGSAKFAKLIREGRFEEALAVARSQIEGGAQVIDICFDDGMIDGPAAMRRFLNMAAAEPEIARVPVMIDSSSWEVLEAGLQCVQGKAIVNSISLKEGEELFLRRASLIRRYGAAAVVMLFDERGQADVYERKIEVAGRAYALLTAAGFPPEDIVFDPNVLAVATGIPEHDVYARDFIRATEWMRANLPGVNVSGGISNLSFAFRGIDRVRRAMHSVFLYHGRRAGLNFGIVNPAMTDLGRGCGAGTRGGCRRASGRLCPAHPGRERVGRQDRCGRGVALVARGGADISCDGEGARRTDRRRCAGGRGRRNDAPRGDRPLLHARHGACGRALRAGKDVSAAGGEDGPCDEKGSGRPHASARGGRPGERRQGEGIARYGKGRCARHRKEYRIGGDGLQRLPHPRPGSDGRVRGDRGYGPRMEPT